MTKQTLFNRVVRHLRAQGKPAASPTSGNCYYRVRDAQTDAVLKCAIGCLIPDARYTPDMEGQAAEWKAVREAAGLEQTHLRLAMRLQAVHDTKAPSEWEKELQTVAKHYRLRMPA